MHSVCLPDIPVDFGFRRATVSYKLNALAAKASQE